MARLDPLLRELAKHQAGSTRSNPHSGAATMGEVYRNLGPHPVDGGVFDVTGDGAAW